MLLTKAFKALTQYHNKTQTKKWREGISDSFHCKNLKQRVIGALKYNLVIAKSLNIIQVKRNNYYLISGLESFKWNWEVKRSQIEFNSIVDHRKMKYHFYAWFQVYQINKVRRDKMKSILDRKHYYDCLESFGIWKKDTFFRTMVNLIDEFVQQPNDSNLVSDVFYAWRRAHEFEKVEEYCQQLADTNSNYLAMKHTFTAWRKISILNLKTYLRIKQGLNIITNTMISQPYFELIAISEKEKVKENKAYYFLFKKQQKFTVKLFKGWKDCIQELKIENQKVLDISHYFKSKTATFKSLYNETDFGYTDELSNMLNENNDEPKFKLPVKLQVQTLLIRAFQ